MAFQMCFAAINILLILLVIVTTLLGEQLQWWSNHKSIIELGYRKISSFVNHGQIIDRSIAGLKLRLRQIIHLVATDESRYFA